MNRYDNWKLRGPDMHDLDADPNCEMCEGSGYVKEDADPDNEHECACTSKSANMRRAQEERDQIAEDRYYGGMR